MTTTPTFVPNESDQRELGIVIDRLTLETVGARVVRPSWTATAASMTLGALLGGVMALACLSGPVFIVLVVGLSLFHAHVVTLKWLPFTSASVDQLTMTWSVIAIPLCVAWALTLTARSGAVHARRVIAFSGVAAFIKFVLVFHPFMTVGDSIFHVNRLRLVLRGTYFFTSTSPGGDLPYPIALYLISSPLTLMTGDWAPMLRVFVLLVDILAGAALALAVWRAWGSTAASTMTLVAYHLVPAGFQVHAVAYLTNAFGHGLSVITVSALPSLAGRRRWATVPAVVGLALVALVSHLGPFLLLSVCLAVTAVAWRLFGGDDVRRAATTLAMVTTIAVVLSVLMYWGHFGATYRQLGSSAWTVSASDLATEVPVQRAEAHQTQWVPDVRAIWNRAGAVSGYAQKYWGWGLMVLSGIGFALMLKARRRDPFALMLWSWVATGLCFLVVGVLTPLDVRTYLWLGPALGCTAAYAVAGSGGQPWILRAGTWMGCLVMGLEGVSYWLAWFGDVLPR